MVWKAIERRSKQEVAVKITPLDQLENLKAEIALQSLSKHPNVVNFLETYQFKEEIWLILELMNGGALTKLVGTKINWPEKCMAYVLQQCLQGLEALHSRFRMHRDIKSDNILFDFDGRIKLADFGFATALHEDQKFKQSVVG